MIFHTGSTVTGGTSIIPVRVFGVYFFYRLVLIKKCMDKCFKVALKSSLGAEKQYCERIL